MTVEEPEVSNSRDRRRRNVRLRDVIGLIARSAPLPEFEQRVDLRGLEASERKVEFDVEFGDVLQLERHELLVPTGVFGQLVVGNAVGAYLCLGHLAEANRWHLLYAKQLCSLDPPVSCYHAAVAIEEDRIVEPELANTVGNLPDLLCRVGTGITSIGGLGQTPGGTRPAVP